GAAHDGGGVEGEVVLAPDLAVEVLQDAGRLVDGPGTHAVVEDAGRMGGPGRDVHTPGAGAPSRDDAQSRRSPFETQRDVGGLTRLYQRPPGLVQGLARSLFVAGHDHGDGGAVQRPLTV